MANYRKGSHSVHDIKYHFVWITKYRYKILDGDLGIRIRDIIKEVCMAWDVIILKGVVSKDHVHVHVLVSCPPTLAPSKLVQLMKGKSSFRAQQEFPALKKRYWGQHIWARGYFVSSSGSVTDEMIKEYLDNHKSNEVSENFIVE